MSGRDKSAERRQEQLAQEQAAQAKAQLEASNARMAKMDTLQAPATSFYSGVASGDPLKALTAMAVPLSNLEASTKAATQGVFDTVAEGPARDYALSKISRDAPAAKGALMNQAFMESLGKLFGMGTESGQTGMQQLGAGSRFQEAEANTNTGLMDAAAKRKAATMGAIGQLAGMAGSAVMPGGAFGKGGAFGGKG